MKLADLQPGQKAIVKTIGDLGELRDRLMELGLLCGETVQLLRRAPLGDPLEFSFGNEKIALREEDARKIDVEPISRPHREEKKESV
ncbi:FeoA family protein [Hydrogenimonas sp.]